jgi:hypothetical protein
MTQSSSSRTLYVLDVRANSTRTTWTSPISRALHELGVRADSDSHDLELRMTRSSRALHELGVRANSDSHDLELRMTRSSRKCLSIEKLDQLNL